MESKETAQMLADVLSSKKARDVVIINISEKSSFADYFVICSAQTNTQVKALTENVADKVKTTFGRLPIGRENDVKNRWNLVDYGDVVVHILHQDEREAYALEKFWNHAFSIPAETWLKESEEYSDYN